MRGFAVFLMLTVILIVVLSACDRDIEPEIDVGLSIPFELERNRIVLPVRFNDSPELRIVLDTGMHFDGLLLYDKELTDQLDLDHAIEVKVPGAGSGPPATAVMADSASFSAGPVEFHNQRIIILQDDRMQGVPSDGVIGNGLLSRFNLMFDYRNERLYLEPNDMFDAPAQKGADG